MIIAPFNQSIVANFAPEDKRGRYMAIFNLHWTIPSLFGVIVAGLIMDHFNPNLVWYLSGIICLIAVLGLIMLQRITKDRLSEKEEKSI
jgi:MFS family permease